MESMKIATKLKIKDLLYNIYGSTDWLYQDAVGNPCIGIGLKLSKISDMSWFGIGTEDAWEKVKLSAKGMNRDWYQCVCSWRADLDHLESLYLLQFRDIEMFMSQHFPAWKTWPEATQIAVFCCIWEIGPYLAGFPKFTAALKDQDWDNAKLYFPYFMQTEKFMKLRNAFDLSPSAD